MATSVSPGAAVPGSTAGTTTDSARLNSTPDSVVRMVPASTGTSVGFGFASRTVPAATPFGTTSTPVVGTEISTTTLISTGSAGRAKAARSSRGRPSAVTSNNSSVLIGSDAST